MGEFLSEERGRELLTLQAGTHEEQCGDRKGSASV
jgi:hypothetical protein